MAFVILIYIVHIILCIVLLYAWRARRIEAGGALLWIAVMIPIWGPLQLYTQLNADADAEGRQLKGFQALMHNGGITTKLPWATQEGVEKQKDQILSGETEMPDEAGEVSEEQYYSVRRSVQVESDEMRGKVVPIEEALLVNDTKTRRELIVDVLYANPEEYVSQLYKAKANPDTEVVHYAATALAEIQKEFDLAFHDIAQRKAKNPMDTSIDQEYLLCLERYIDSGLLEGDALMSQLRLYSETTGRKLKEENVNGRWTLLNKKADADVRLGDTAALDEDIAMMEEIWPGRDAIYRYKLESAMLQKDSGRIRELIAQMDEENVFLTTRLREMVKFWEE